MKELLATILPCYMIPRFILLPSLPLLVNGKTDRQALLKKYEESLVCTEFNFTKDDFSSYLSPAFYPQARVVLEVVASVVKDPTRKPTLKDNFFDIGGDSINMVQVISKFLDRGCFLSMTDFVTSNSLRDVAVKMTFQEKEEDISLVMKEMEKTNMFKSVSLDECHKKVVLEMIARSFASKGDLTTLASVGYNTLLDQLDGLWEALLKANLSIVVLNAAGQNSNLLVVLQHCLSPGVPVAACLNFDARSEEAAPLCAQSAFSRSQPLDQKKEEEDEAKKSSDSSLTVVDFLQEVEEPLAS